MSANRSRSRTEGTDEERIDEVLEAFHAECRVVPGIGEPTLLFRTPAGALVDASGREIVPSGESEHVAHRAIANGRPVRDLWPGEESEGLAYPVAAGSLRAVAWLPITSPAGDESLFLIDAAADRLSRELARAADRFCAARREASFRLVREALDRLLTETSLHRALRLSAQQLVELSGASEASIWRFLPEADPVCLATAGARAESPDRERAVRRLVGDVASGPEALRVSDTRASDHFGWCAGEGIKRFLVRPLQAYDRVHGAVVVVNFCPAPPAIGGGPAPGFEDACALLAGAAAQSLHQIETQERASALDGELRDTRRQLERAESEGARLELARHAADALEDAFAEIADSAGLDADAEGADADGPFVRVERLIAELRELARAPEARLKMTDVNEVIHQAASTVRSRPTEPAASISLRLSGDLPPLLLDVRKVGAMLVDLIEHGIAGTERRHAVVTSRLSKGEVVIEIRIPGRAVSGSVLESLFLPFSGGEEARRGLGLALADQIIGEHGGQLRARSEPGEGLLYWLSLPVSDNQDRRHRRIDRRGRNRRRGEESEAA